MKGRMKKEYILLGGILFVLGLALVQLGTLIYKNYTSAQEEIEYIQFQVEHPEHVTISLYQKENKVQPGQNGEYILEKGKETRLCCETEQGYGIKGAILNEKKQKITDIQYQEFLFLPVADGTCRLETKKVFQVRIEDQGGGKTKLGEKEQEQYLVFEGEKITVQCTANENSYIKRIKINDKSYLEHNDGEEYKEAESYTIEAVENDCVIRTEYEIKKYKIQVEENECVEILINNHKTNELIVNAGSTVEIHLECKRKEDTYLKRIRFEKKIHQLSSVQSQEEDIVLSKINKDYFIEVKAKTIPKKYIDPKDLIEVQDESLKEGTYSIIKQGGRITYFFNTKGSVIIKPGKRVREFVSDGEQPIYESVVFKHNEKWRQCEYIEKEEGNVMYPYPIYFIFDRIAPSKPTYTLTHSASPTIRLTTTINDSGDSGVASAQFGTKADYDANLSPDQTKAKYGYEYTNLSGSTYAIEFDKDKLPNQDYYIWGADNALNRSEPTKVDLAGPEITLTSKEDWVNHDVCIEGIAKDTESPVESIYYSQDEKQASSHYSGKRGKDIHRITPNSDGSFQIKTTSKQSGILTFYIWSYDSYGNKSAEMKTYQLRTDRTPPKLSLLKKAPKDRWTNKQVIMEFQATDSEGVGYSGIDTVYYVTNQEMSRPIMLEVNKDEQQSYVIQTPKDEDGTPVPFQGYYSIYARDKAGNLSEPLNVDINIDVDAPKPYNVQMVQKDGTEVRTTSYGTFANQSVIFKVSTLDRYMTERNVEAVESGTKEIVVLQDGKEIARTEVKANKGKKEVASECTFEIPPQLVGELSVVTYDWAGNISDPIKINDINSSYHSWVCIETTRPEIQIGLPDPDYQKEGALDWYATHQDMRMQVDDPLSGIRNIQAAINGKAVSVQANGQKLPQTEQEMIEETSFVINSAQAGESEDGSYTVQLTVYDNAGNVTTKTRTIYVDDRQPIITKFAFEAVGVQENKDKLMEEMEYGYFFNGPTKVTISAADQAPSSGMKEIEYYLVDYEKDPQGVESKKKRVPIDKEGNASFLIEKPFKGKICARAYDEVQNTTTHFAKPYGMVIDSNGKEDKHSKIAFTAPETTKKDEAGIPLYEKDVPIIVDVANYFKGIRSVEWEVQQDGQEKQKGKLEVSLQGQILEAQTPFKILETDKNLVTHLQGKIKVSGNTNRIRLHVILTDRSGNQSEKETCLSIDKSRPQVSIAFDHTNPSSYYKEGRVATIQVKDRNFSPDHVALKLENTLGSVPKLSGWRKQKDGETYTATLSFQEDGQYTLHAVATDLAQNISEQATAEVFTIDKTKPTIEVSINGQLRNTNYFRQSVQARIKITERNFDLNRVEVTGEAKNKKQSIAYPKLHTIEQGKEHYVLALDFQQEGEYTLQVKCTDKAGNMAQSSNEYHFIVDKSAPIISIDGVEEHKAYNGRVVPTITVRDTNYQEHGTNIQIMTGKGKVLTVHPQVKKVEEGYRFALDCFPKKKEFDQVYGLKVESRDLAGNETKKEVHFSINRFGSTYEFSEMLQKASGKYINGGFDVVLSEVNINAVDPSKSLVRMICNDTVRDLVENKDYIVVCSGGNGEWYTYQYRISKELMKEDGVYQFAFYTKDEAGNVNENVATGKKALVWFGIDRTAPRVVPINISEGGTYNETKRLVSFSVDDNIKLNDVKIYVNGTESTYKTEGNQYFIEVGSSNQAQSVRIVATDEAGNQNELTISNLYITTDLMVRMLHNRTVVVGCSIGGTIVLSLITVFLMLRYRGRKRKQNR